MRHPRYSAVVQNPEYSLEVFVWDHEARRTPQDERGINLAFPYRMNVDSQQAAMAKALRAIALLNAGEPIPNGFLV